MPRASEQSTSAREKLVRAFAFFALLLAVVWLIPLVIALLEIYLLRSFPYGFADWIVNIQTRNDLFNIVKNPHHGRTYYLLRFGISTVLIEGFGILGYLRLKRRQP